MPSRLGLTSPPVLYRILRVVPCQSFLALLALLLRLQRGLQVRSALVLSPPLRRPLRVLLVVLVRVSLISLLASLLSLFPFIRFQVTCPRLQRPVFRVLRPPLVPVCPARALLPLRVRLSFRLLVQRARPRRVRFSFLFMEPLVCLTNFRLSFLSLILL